MRERTLNHGYQVSTRIYLSRDIMVPTRANLPTSMRKSSAFMSRYQSKLLTTLNSPTPPMPCMMDVTWVAMVSAFARAVSAGKRFLSADLPEGSPIWDVAPPAIGKTKGGTKECDHVCTDKSRPRECEKGKQVSNVQRRSCKLGMSCNAIKITYLEFSRWMHKNRICSQCVNSKNDMGKPVGSNPVYTQGLARKPFTLAERVIIIPLDRRLETTKSIFQSRGEKMSKSLQIFV